MQKCLFLLIRIILFKPKKMYGGGGTAANADSKISDITDFSGHISKLGF